MTGNDIIDLTTAASESNWKRKGFIEKLFTPKEQLYIRQATVPEEMVWKLWSMKESAYKIYSRQLGLRSFAPQKFNCTMLNGLYGQVDINNVSYSTISSTAGDYIYSVAKPVGHLYDPYINCCFNLLQPGFADQQKFICDKLIACYAGVTNTDKLKLCIIKDKNNIPFLYCKNENTKIPVSITHHGRYAAFTIH